MSEIKRLKRDAPPSFNKKSNEDQYEATKCVLDAVEDVFSSLERKDLSKTKEYLEKGMSLLKERQKLILLAVKSPYGWKSVLEYKHHDLAEDDEAEKKIYRAEDRAARASLNTGNFFRFLGTFRPASPGIFNFQSCPLVLVPHLICLLSFSSHWFRNGELRASL